MAIRDRILAAFKEKEKDPKNDDHWEEFINSGPIPYESINMVRSIVLNGGLMPKDDLPCVIVTLSHYTGVQLDWDTLCFEEYFAW